MVDRVQGDSGAFCHYCNATRAEIWESLKPGEIAYNDKERMGQIHKPLKLLYHPVSDQTHTWSEGNYRIKDALKSSKKETIKHIRSKLGFLTNFDELFRFFCLKDSQTKYIVSSPTTHVKITCQN